MTRKRYTKEEDKIILGAREAGASWEKISSELLPERSATSIQKRYLYLGRKKGASPTEREWRSGTSHPQFVVRTTGEGFVRDESAPVLAWDGSALVWVRWTRETTEYYETNCWRSVPDGEQVRVRHWISIPTPPDMVLA